MKFGVQSSNKSTKLTQNWKQLSNLLTVILTEDCVAFPTFFSYEILRLAEG
uniref:Uncharacterized protein n=1 Tax=Anguilla anguilla TaxID=7936 RepID=A0A0E9RAB4_ANGAN